MTPNRDISNVKVIGTGHTRFGRTTQTLEDLIADAAQEALTDAGIDGAGVDAIFLGHFNAALVPDAFAAPLVSTAAPGLRNAPAVRCENACASGMAAVQAGVDAIRAGRARVVLVVGAEKMTHRTTQEVTVSLSGAGYQNDASEAGLSFPGVFALAARAYAERYGDPLPAMARIASKNHINAMSNPLAQMHKPLSVEHCASISDTNPEVAPPLRLSDCSLISDGAAAVVLSAERPSISETCIQFRALEQVNDTLPLASRDFPAFEGPTAAIRRAYDAAGITVGDLNFAEVHDCFTIAELLLYESLGLAPAGQGHRVLEDGTVFRDGALPVNVSGGLKAKGHPVGATGVSMLVTAARQLSGRAGEMQLSNPQLGLILNMGGAGVANYAAVVEAA